MWIIRVLSQEPVTDYYKLYPTEAVLGSDTVMHSSKYHIVTCCIFVIDRGQVTYLTKYLFTFLPILSYPVVKKNQYYVEWAIEKACLIIM